VKWKKQLLTKGHIISFALPASNLVFQGDHYNFFGSWDLQYTDLVFVPMFGSHTSLFFTQSWHINDISICKESPLSAIKNIF
jgi:hypothetical protein